MSVISAGSCLKEGQYIKSGNGYSAVMQKDGNFVLYSSGHWVSKNALWSSQTCGKGIGPFCLSMQKDGNLVIYDRNGTPTWASNTCNKGAYGHWLVMQKDGNLVLYDGKHKCTWASGTHR